MVHIWSKIRAHLKHLLQCCPLIQWCLFSVGKQARFLEYCGVHYQTLINTNLGDDLCIGCWNITVPANSAFEDNYFVEQWCLTYIVLKWNHYIHMATFHFWQKSQLRVHTSLRYVSFCLTACYFCIFAWKWAIFFIADLSQQCFASRSKEQLPCPPGTDVNCTVHSKTH